ncbi:MAG: hypothetical protein U9Q78_07055, partial [Chloroflexota bacterium]|nr:hypothetical protein [Chloroflexota bacterium]
KAWQPLNSDNSLPLSPLPAVLIYHGSGRVSNSEKLLFDIGSHIFNKRNEASPPRGMLAIPSPACAPVPART